MEDKMKRWVEDDIGAVSPEDGLIWFPISFSLGVVCLGSFSGIAFV